MFRRQQVCDLEFDRCAARSNDHAAEVPVVLGGGIGIAVKRRGGDGWMQLLGKLGGLDLVVVGARKQGLIRRQDGDAGRAESGQGHGELADRDEALREGVPTARPREQSGGRSDQKAIATHPSGVRSEHALWLAHCRAGSHCFFGTNMHIRP